MKDFLKLTFISSVLMVVSGFIFTPPGAPPGTIIHFGGSTCPAGTIVMDGSSVLRTAYPGLFTAIGTTYGSSDGTHFSLPNAQGLFLRGVGSQSFNGKTYATTLGTSQGDSTAVNGVHDTGHTHGPLAPGNNYLYGSGGGTGANSGGGTNGGFYAGSTASATANLSGDAETRPANLAVTMCIYY